MKERELYGWQQIQTCPSLMNTSLSYKLYILLQTFNEIYPMCEPE